MLTSKWFSQELKFLFFLQLQLILQLALLVQQQILPTQVQVHHFFFQMFIGISEVLTMFSLVFWQIKLMILALAACDAGGGSKAVPSSGNGSSDATSIRLTVSVLFFLVFTASYVSNFSMAWLFTGLACLLCMTVYKHWCFSEEVGLVGFYVEISWVIFFI